jgi:hypothetical protein
MYTANQLCEKIISIYPEIGECGIDINVEYNKMENTWMVHLKKGSHKLDHFLETIDADSCMEGKKCISLGLEIAQLMKNIKGEQF